MINPVQISAKDMEPARLKREFGSDIVFGGRASLVLVLDYSGSMQIAFGTQSRIRGYRS